MDRTSIASTRSDIASAPAHGRAAGAYPSARPARIHELLPSEALFWKPRPSRLDKFTGYTPLLFWLMEVIRPNVLLQIGLEGTSGYFALCQASERLSPGTLCFGVATDEEALTEAVRAGNQAYAAFSFLQTGGVGASAIPDGALLDLLVIQDPLTLELAADIATAVLPRLSDRAVILICDCDAAETVAVHGLLGERAERTTLFSLTPDLPGCVLALWGPDQPERLQSLVQQQPGMPGWLIANNVFATLGVGIAASGTQEKLRKQAGSLQDDLAQLQAENDDLSGRCNDLEHHAELLELDLATVRQDRERAKAEHGERIDDIAILTAHFQAKLEEATKTTKAEAAKASALQTQVQDLRRQLDEIKKRATAQANDKSARDKQVEDLTQRLNEAREHRDSLLNSTSWKITRPIRTMVRLLRGY